MNRQTLDKLSYHQAQKRNTTKFESFTKKQRKDLRDRGYNNRGWNNVIKTWGLVEDLIKVINQAGDNKVVNLAYKRAEKLMSEAVDKAVTIDQIDFDQLRQGINDLSKAAINSIVNGN